MTRRTHLAYLAAIAVLVVAAVVVGWPDARVFVCYSRDDAEAAESLCDLLDGVGVEYWIDDDVQSGDHWRTEIHDALDSSDTVLVMWSAAASESRDVYAEWHYAVARGKRVLPILLDDTELPPALTRFQWVDLHADGSAGDVPPIR